MYANQPIFAFRRVILRDLCRFHKRFRKCGNDMTCETPEGKLEADEYIEGIYDEIEQEVPEFSFEKFC